MQRKRGESMAGDIVMKAVGDQAVLVKLGDSISEAVSRRVMALDGAFRKAGLKEHGILETVPAYHSLLIRYDPLVTDYSSLMGLAHALAEQDLQASKSHGRRVEIPVCYGGAYGGDLAYVAQHAGLSQQEVVEIHCGKDYRVYMLGFLPGFPYLGGLDERIFTPRLPKPRVRIPAGSVGIGGEQTGIYPLESPGGWRLIGRTPLRLFDPLKGGELPYMAGDCIRFIPIGEEEFYDIAGRQEAG